MSRKKTILAVILVVGMAMAIFHAVRWEMKEPNANGMKQDSFRDINKSADERKSKNHPNDESVQDFVDPVEAIEDFNRQFPEIQVANGVAWEAGLQELAAITNRLRKQAGFKSAIATALMVKRTSDLVISRLMAGEVSEEETLRGLKSFNYRIPTEQQMIEFICELQPDGMKLRENHPADSVFDFVSRIEPDVVFPEDWLTEERMPTGLLNGKNMTFSLLIIVGAEVRLEAARIAATYLLRGGDPDLKGEYLETALTTRVGEEIEKLPVPLFGAEKPTAASIGFIIDHAAGVSQ